MLWTVAHQAPLSLGNLQATILDGIAMPFSRGFSRPRDGTYVSYVSSTGSQVFYHWYHLRSPASNFKASNPWLFNSRALALQWLLHSPRNSFPRLFIYASLGFSPSLGVDFKARRKTGQQESPSRLRKSLSHHTVHQAYHRNDKEQGCWHPNGVPHRVTLFWSGEYKSSSDKEWCVPYSLHFSWEINYAEV